MRAVRRGSSPRARAVGGWVLTALALLLVLLALNLPSRLQRVEPAVFLRLPLEALAYLAVVLALPTRLARVRVALALAAGFVLGVIAVFRLLDMGFLQSLNRRFDPLIDWSYADSLVETVRDSIGDGPGTVLLVAAAVAAVATLALMPLSTLRVTRVAVEHRRTTSRAVAALASLWLVLALLDVKSAGGMLASRDTLHYALHQVTRIPAQLRDQREFAEAAESDPFRRVPAQDLLTGLRGKDVLFVFVESYGRVAIEKPSVAPGVNAVLAAGTRQLDDAGFASRSAFLTSPAFGAISWLAHATFQSGLWVDSQPRYDLLVTSPRLTLSRLFARAGWRTVAEVPANNRDWPQGGYYDYDHIYDSRNVGYRGPRFGYPTMPDQYTLDAFHRLELASEDRRPVMAEIDLITSHAPWSRIPRLIDQASVGDGSVYNGMPRELASSAEVWSSPERVRKAYGDAIEYSLRSVLSFVTHYGDDDLVLVVLGDHQPATIVSGPGASHDVPISIISRDRAVLDRISGWGWTDGLRPDRDAPVWRMDAFRDRFLTAYGPDGEPGARPVTAR